MNMSDDYLYDDAFKSQLDAEALLLMQMNRIAMFRDSDLKRYCSSVETFILMCPRTIRDKALSRLHELGLIRGQYKNITEEKLIVYDDLYMYVEELLEKNRMIWKKKNIKTYG